MSLPSRIILVDIDPELIAGWSEAFHGIDSARVRAADFFADAPDAVVSPANSFGFTDGGLDLLIRSTLGGIETSVRRMIVERHQARCQSVAPRSSSPRIPAGLTSSARRPCGCRQTSHALAIPSPLALQAMHAKLLAT